MLNTKTAFWILVVVPVLLADSIQYNSRRESYLLQEIDHQNQTSSSATFSPMRGHVLFVEDPGDDGFGPAVKPDPLWVNTLNEILGSGNYGWFGPTLEPGANGPDLSMMQNYDLVIWNTYDYWWGPQQNLPSALTSTDQNNIASYIANGGKVWLLGDDIIASGVPISWLSTNFHLNSVNADYCHDAINLTLYGLAEINGISFTAHCDYQHNGFWCDALFPDAQAHYIIRDSTYHQYNSIAYPNALPLQTSFWTVDGRNPSPWSQWIAVVTAMLQAFGAYGVTEVSNSIPQKNMKVEVNPSLMGSSVKILCYFPISNPSKVIVRIYDKNGRLLRTLLDSYKSTGSYQIIWDGRNDKGSIVSNGIYFILVNCGENYGVAKVIVLR